MGIDFSLPKTVARRRLASHQVRGRSRRGVTLMELLIVIAIITLLMAILMPALNVARESARGNACQTNLRQFSVGLFSHAQRHNTLCSGAFDWKRDGCPTEIGWVADLVNSDTPVGTMLCPSNPAKIAEVYNDLLEWNPGWASYWGDPCNCTSEDRLKGSAPQSLPDGSLSYNPCRYIVETSPADRASVVQTEVFEEKYNTNYTASWYLVRGGVLLQSGGTLQAPPGCTGSTDSRGSTSGPLTLDLLDAAAAPSSFIPLLGCGSASSTASLAAEIGGLPSGSPVVVAFTGGPVDKATANPPATFTPGSDAYLQDYRQFAPVHRGTCNILFGDGSVRSYIDQEEDGLLNNGFPSGVGGFASEKIELPEDEFMSGWSLRERRRGIVVPASP